MADSTMVVTGATGFIGRHLVEAFHREYDVWAISRAAPSLRGVSLPAGVRWLPLDVANARDLRAGIEPIRQAGGAEILVHLAGHYDFTGERDPEYLRTNVDGTRNVLEAACDLGVRDVVFASSVAACGFPPPGGALTEATPPDGDTPYAESKRAGESMVAGHRGRFRAWIVRFAAVFSDWCEYEPLFRFLESWLALRPTRRILAGSGRSAIPYLHVRDAVTFFQALLSRRDALGDGAVLLASPDGATSHRELFEVATGAQHGLRERPVFVPGSLCRAGLWARDLMGLVTGMHAFERPWMGRMIDLRLTVDASRTRAALGWEPRARFGILRRMPFLVQNRKSFGAEWLRRNHVALKGSRRHQNLEVVALLEQRRDEVAESLAAWVTSPERTRRFPHLRAMGAERQRADGTLLLGALVEAVRTGEKALFQDTCKEMARQRRREGLPSEELTGALDALGDLCALSLVDHDPSRLWSLWLQDHVTMTVQFGIDGVLDVFESEPG
ncbi:MAG TPA: NAD(P)-dependent oxidoreductase [Anaeromyxobacteraceae bacterium]|nr:NAD(P)-dependent oxidoreductase [Anaeromyxobacteraceae bacterium]